MAEPPKGDRNPSSAGQSCRECRRRKGKCDGKMPVCSICQRYNRHCLYDKHSRSSLTRKHLTEVEERLEKAEALLKTFFTDTELSQMLAHGVTNGVNVALRPLLNAPGAKEAHSTQQQAATSPAEPPRARTSSAAGAPGSTEPFSSYGHETAPISDFSFQQPATSSDTTPLPFESLPTADDDFEWDEREPSWPLADPGREVQAFESDVEADIPKITDGMATLTANDSNAGFLGSVSGAALLRLIWMGSSTDEGDNRPEVKIERRRSLEELFTNRADGYSTSLSWLPARPLITRPILDNLVDAYFAFYHPTFPILHEPTFREQYSRLNGRPGGSTWHILANLVAALGSFVSTACSDDTHITLFNAVKANLTVESLETGSLSLVQAFAMAANYLQKRNRPNSGYNYGGIALRLAISLGLHKDFHGWQTAPFKKEMRRRVWWSLCVLDVGATITYGRPLNWPQVGVETAFPMNIHEQDLTPDSTTVPAEANEATLYTYIRTQSLYHLRTMRIYNRLISNPVPSAAELISLDDDLVQGWLVSLPSYYGDGDLPLSEGLLLGHAIGRWRYRLLRIIMYRPFLIRWAQDGSGSVAALSSPPQATTAESIATRRCFKAAEECISCIYQFWAAGTHTRLAAWYVLYFLLQAALIPIHCLRRNPAHIDAGSWRAQISTALEIINTMTNLNPSAPKCRDIIYRLCGDSLHARPSSPNPNSNSIRFQQRQAQTQPQHQTQCGLQRHNPDAQPPPPLPPVGPTATATATARSSTTDSWPTGFPMAGFANPAFSYSTPDEEDTGADSSMLDPWMTEVDTAIDNYDMYCDRLSNAAMAGIRMDTQTQFGDNTSEHVGEGGTNTANVQVPFNMDGTEIGTGVQDWDWGLLL